MPKYITFPLTVTVPEDETNVTEMEAFHRLQNTIGRSARKWSPVLGPALKRPRKTDTTPKA